MGVSVMMHVAQRRIPHENLQETIVRNAAILYKRDWKQRDPRGQTVYNIANRLSKPRLDTLELIVSKAKVPAWYLLLPLSEETLTHHDLADLVHAYISLDPEGQEYVLAAVKFALRAMS